MSKPRKKLYKCHEHKMAKLWVSAFESNDHLQQIKMCTVLFMCFFCSKDPFFSFMLSKPKPVNKLTVEYVLVS